MADPLVIAVVVSIARMFATVSWLGLRPGNRPVGAPRPHVQQWNLSQYALLFKSMLSDGLACVSLPILYIPRVNMSTPSILAQTRTNGRTIRRAGVSAGPYGTMKLASTRSTRFQPFRPPSRTSTASSTTFRLCPIKRMSSSELPRPNHLVDFSWRRPSSFRT